MPHGMSSELFAFTRFVSTYVNERASAKPGGHGFAHAGSVADAAEMHTQCKQKLKWFLSPVPEKEQDYERIREICVNGSRSLQSPIDSAENIRRAQIVEEALGYAGLAKPAQVPEACQAQPKASLAAQLNDPYERRNILTPYL